MDWCDFKYIYASKKLRKEKPLKKNFTIILILLRLDFNDQSSLGWAAIGSILFCKTGNARII